MRTLRQSAFHLARTLSAGVILSAASMTAQAAGLDAAVPTSHQALSLMAQANEWRADWVAQTSTEEAPFYNHVIGTMCDLDADGEFASALEAIQRFKTKEAIEQFRGEFGEGLSALKMTHPLIWQAAQAMAKTGHSASSQLYGKALPGQGVLEVPLQSSKARVPIGSRICPGMVEPEYAEQVLRSLGLDGSDTLAHFEVPFEGVPVPRGELPYLVQGVEWQAILAGDGHAEPLSVSTEGKHEVMQALWDDLTIKLEPIGLRFDVQASYVNAASIVQQRTWALPDGRWITLVMTSGAAYGTASGEDTSLLFSLVPASS